MKATLVRLDTRFFTLGVLVPQDDKLPGPGSITMPGLDTTLY
ncbi:MAG TPA: hypothetical protein VMW70_07880 [Burkholderiales bacterium]|nr:hypothetical protein [Burkholderiales bacterium]